MSHADGVHRDLRSIRLARWGRVVPADDVVPYLVVGPDGRPVEPIRRFLRDFLAGPHSEGSVRSYAYALHRWWRFLHAIGVPWDKATSEEVRDFVLWMGQAHKQRRHPRTKSAATAGQINPITRKQYPGDRYQPRTIRHSNAVLRTFYEFALEVGEGPLVNPVRRDRSRGRRANAHHNPLEPFRPEGRLRYNPKLPRQRPRAMPDERWIDFFTAMRSNRDRAILALALSTAARASELLGIRGADVDWGDQLVQVRRKGSGAQQWLPASAESFIWLRLHLDELGEVGANDPVWWTLRRRRRPGEGLRHRPLTYDALRAVLRRANEALGTNWTMHDLRHTSALRMVRSAKLSLRDVQVILGHQHLTTTQIYLVEDDDEVLRRVRRYLADQDQAADEPQPEPVAVGYNADDLAVLLGGIAR
ncbi:site-specific integrase [Streptomyces antimycoticus]|uniref:tyrosine-type recombinase/integrase n=1 Tax=Streptomyces antimycoticus TaxID=68175 RepID=UPI00343C8EB4